ncbi:MAG: hypothetical protein MJE77_04950 [Proteobacteria bacterium]|nr:hypothetical protein [Pseudomonadota bacterium]
MPTASRWLSDIRQTLLERTREELTRRHPIDDTAVDSVMRLRQSDPATGIHDMLHVDLDRGE